MALQEDNDSVKDVSDKEKLCWNGIKKWAKKDSILSVRVWYSSVHRPHIFLLTDQKNHNSCLNMSQTDGNKSQMK